MSSDAIDAIVVSVITAVLVGLSIIVLMMSP